MRVRVLEEPMQYSTEIRISVEAAYPASTTHNCFVSLG